ncbi:YcxB family protein [Vallitalea pronyensis]|uniref:YcxB family protein n=1 Tax=Vallitalea pronyensis TaxID=1348613 RepID=A0A8J8MNA7_9FIRM|nr:YcxB family protein [Vallitalea pronyensis]QUI24378.1 YcxB family protein [Vallitalea pronyensis]
MQIIIEQDNPKQIHLDGYKKYFRSHYKKEIIISLLVMIISLWCVYNDAIIIFGYIGGSFAIFYLLFLWLFFYKGPISAIMKRKSSKSIIIINSEEICIKGESAEFKYYWKAIKKVYLISKYIFIIAQDNRFIIIDNNDLEDNDMEKLHDFFIKNKVKIND